VDTISTTPFKYFVGFPINGFKWLLWLSEKKTAITSSYFVKTRQLTILNMVLAPFYKAVSMSPYDTNKLGFSKLQHLKALSCKLQRRVILYTRTDVSEQPACCMSESSLRTATAHSFRTLLMCNEHVFASKTVIVTLTVVWTSHTLQLMSFWFVITLLFLSFLFLYTHSLPCFLLKIVLCLLIYAFHFFSLSFILSFY
jgi:hypothetical protein